MERQECEKTIIQKMKEIKEIINQYNPQIEHLNMYVSEGCGWAFMLKRDKNGNPITGEYLININY